MESISHLSCSQIQQNAVSMGRSTISSASLDGLNSSKERKSTEYYRDFKKRSPISTANIIRCVHLNIIKGSSFKQLPRHEKCRNVCAQVRKVIYECVKAISVFDQRRLVKIKLV